MDNMVIFDIMTQVNMIGRRRMARTPKKLPSRSRAATKELRRQQLIDSTLDSIAKRGFSETTMANVADGAGLSRGIVNFHFQSKKTLLEATLQFLAEEYRAAWRHALDRAGTDPAERLLALMMTDFDPVICNRKKLAVWFAFFGEAKSRPTYMNLCATRDREHWEAVCGLCREILAGGDYRGRNAETIASGLSAVLDGLWLDMLLSPTTFDRDAARQVVDDYLASVFSRHFPLNRRSVA
jgi:TetR/AcrR family transcriptional repressor of bet genes